jgi:Fe-S cluster assembly protein SufD
MTAQTEHEEFHALLERLYRDIAPADPLLKNRSKAWDLYMQKGLPTRDNEVFRYIKLRSIFCQPYTLGALKNTMKETIKPHVNKECQKSYIVFINGHFHPELSDLSALPSKVIVTPLEDAVKTYGAFLNNQLTRVVKEENDPFVLFNAALHSKGVFIYVPPKTVIEPYVEILNIIDQEETSLILPRQQISLGTQADVKFLFNTVILSSKKYGINQVVEFALDDGARAEAIQLAKNESEEGWRLDALRAQLKRDCYFKTVSVTQGSMTTRHDYRVAMSGENSEALLHGLLTLKDRREAHNNILIDHQAPHCRSNQLFKGVLSDVSRSSFEGKILVRQEAQKTEAFQLNNNLLLSERANADSKPNLEIFADDVKASHGATIGQLNAEHLFYLKTRGLRDIEAKKLLVNGFCREILDLIPIMT